MLTMAVDDNSPFPLFTSAAAVMFSLNSPSSNFLPHNRSLEKQALLKHSLNLQASYALGKGPEFCISPQVDGRSADLSHTVVSLLFCLFYFCGMEQKESH